MIAKYLKSSPKIRLNPTGLTISNYSLFIPTSAKITATKSFNQTNDLCAKTLCNVSSKGSSRRLISISPTPKTHNQELLKVTSPSNIIWKKFTKKTLNSNYLINSEFLNVDSCNNIQNRGILSVRNKVEGGYKLYPELENSELYKILTKLPELKDTLAPTIKQIINENDMSNAEFQKLLDTDFSICDKAEILESFRRLSFYMFDKEDTLAHSSFDNICRALIQSIKHLSDDEICKLMFLLQIWSTKCFRTERNYFDIFSEIDKVQIERLNKGQSYYSHQQLLLLIDFWAHLNLLRSSNFCKLALKKLLNKSHQLKPKLFVQLMFYHCRYRTFHPLVSAYDVEFNFDKIYSDLTPSEIAIVLLAFFKSEKRFVNSNLCLKIARTFISNVEGLQHSVCISGYLKSMKHYFPFQHWDVLYQVCDKLCENIDFCHHFVLPHAASVGTKIDVYHAKLLDTIVEKTIQNVDNFRIKDFEKVLFPVVLFNHKLKQPELLEIISEEFLSEKREAEVNKHPKSLFSIVHHLIIANHFNIKLIEKCLDIEFLHLAFGKKLSAYVVPKDVLFIDVSVEIEASDYTGPRLPESLKHTLCKHYAWRKPGELFHNKEIKADEFGIAVQNKLKQVLGGERFYQLAYVLPHHLKPDVLVCVKDGKPVPIPESMSDFVHMNAFPPPPTGTWYALVFVTYMQVMKTPEAQYKGPLAVKIRQLKKLGYKPVVMTPSEWINTTEEGRGQIIRDRLGLWSR